MFYQSLVSDWNHGNAHFLRGIATELMARGHEVRIYEPRDGWSRQNLVAEHGQAALQGFFRTYPHLNSILYDLSSLDEDKVLADADLVIVHEWNDHALVKRLGAHRARGGRYRLLFHDTHHRAVTDPETMAGFDLTLYDGVLAFGQVVRDLYLARGWAVRAWTWHEAADTRVFNPIRDVSPEADLVWIGNGGDEERTAELNEFLIGPIAALGLKARVYGVRYPRDLCDALANAHIEYAGWTPNYLVPQILARHQVTVHIPRRPYVDALVGIPTIRPFEAMACGIPLVCSPWDDVEGLFTQGKDYMTARDGTEMQRHLSALLHDRAMALEMAEHARRTILARHTCAHRVDELLGIYEELASQSATGRDERNTRHGARRGTAGPILTNQFSLKVPMTDNRLNIAFFGSSLVSAYWNGAATYYRGLIRELDARGHRVTFYEPNAYERQEHRDIPDPDWARVVVYEGEQELLAALEQAQSADLVVKASGVGVFDAFLEQEVLSLKGPGTAVVFWDVDAPATLDRMQRDPDDPFRALVPRYDLVLTYGGGAPVVNAYKALGARECVPIYNALDPLVHFPVPPDARFKADLGFLGNRLPDREARVDEFFFNAAAKSRSRRFILGGSGWSDKLWPENVVYVGHVYTRDHNAFNCSAQAVLNITRESMARNGFSPPTRVFEAAGAGACLITDAWEGIEQFLEPGIEALVARNGDEVAECVRTLTPERARAIGRAARRRVLSEHTYARRANQFESILFSRPFPIKR